LYMQSVFIFSIFKVYTCCGEMSPKVLCELPVSAVPYNGTVFRIVECIESQIQC
jgi:hypothetical protein